LSKVPAQASLFVRKLECKLNSFFKVAGIDECSYCELFCGAFGSWITAQMERKAVHTAD
jgi:hypothetical protein